MSDKIQGDRELSNDEVDNVNVLKGWEKLVLNQIAQLEQDPCRPDPRWLAIGKTDIQKGFMALIRAINKPE